MSLMLKLVIKCSLNVNLLYLFIKFLVQGKFISKLRELSDIQDKLLSEKQQKSENEKMKLFAPKTMEEKKQEKVDLEEDKS